MPAGNGTGPMGMGSMTGRGAGYCAGSGVPGYMNPALGHSLGMGPGRGFGRGRGGWGWRNMFNATGLTGWQRVGAGWGGGPAVLTAPTKEQQTAALKAQAESLENELSGIRDRLAQIEKSE